MVDQSTRDGDKKCLSDEERFPELFNEAPSINRSKCKREVPMKVLVLGLFRTGTASMKLALEELGLQKCYHMTSVMHDPDDSQWWIRAIDAKFRGKGTFGRKEFDQLLGDCQSVCDFPAALFGPELIAAYPDAKVVLTYRDFDAWYKSSYDTVFNVTRARKNVTGQLVGALDRDYMGQFMEQAMYSIEAFMGPEGPSYENAKKKYFEHYDSIRKCTPKDNLLEYNVKEGWEPLCEFLGIRKPETSFPRVNEAASFHNRIFVMRRRAIQRVFKQYGPYVLALGIGAVAAGVLGFLQRR